MAQVHVRPVSPALVPFVRTLGFFEGELESGRERVLPSGHVSLMVNLHEDEFRTYHGADHNTVRRTRGAAFHGPQARHTVIDTAEQRRLVYVDFRLGGAARFLEAPLDETRDELVDLEDLWGRDGAILRERVLEAQSTEDVFRLVEAALVDHLVSAERLDTSVAFAVQALEHGAPVSQVTTRLNVLPKRFVRRFRSQIGLTPKRFARVRRLQRLLGAASRDSDIDWAEAAAEHGYYDQSHLIHDFRELAGLTPTACRPRAAHEWNHVPVG
jgi:AraC-like DNA-binding protein